MSSWVPGVVRRADVERWPPGCRVHASGCPIRLVMCHGGREARSNAATGRSISPQFEMRGADGTVVTARFDGLDGLEIIDRKTNPMFTAKAVGQARRQAGVVAFNGYHAVWELPTAAAAAAAANRFLDYAKVSTISVRIAG